MIMALIVEQTSNRISKYTWNWEIFLKGEAKELDRIENVRYTVSSAFEDPIQLIEDRASGFKIKCSGMGAHLIYFSIKLKGKEERIIETIHLNFDHPVEKILNIF